MALTGRFLHRSGRAPIPDADTRAPKAESLRDIWRDNPWWAKLLLAIAVGLFVLEAFGVIQDIGLDALNLTAIAFLFSMNRTLREMRSALTRSTATLKRMDATLDGVDATLDQVNSKL